MHKLLSWLLEISYSHWKGRIPLCLRRWRSNADFPVTLLPHWSQKKTGSFCLIRGFFIPVDLHNRCRRLTLLGSSKASFSDAEKSSFLLISLLVFESKWSMPSSSFGWFEFSNLINNSTGLIGASSISSSFPAFRWLVRALRRTQITWVADGALVDPGSLTGDALNCHLLWLRRQRLRNSMAQSKSFRQILQIISGKSDLASNWKYLYLSIVYNLNYHLLTKTPVIRSICRNSFCAPRSKSFITSVPSVSIAQMRQMFCCIVLTNNYISYYFSI